MTHDSFDVSADVVAEFEEANARIWSAGGRPFVREVRVGDGFYQQVISRTPEGGLLGIYATDVTEGRRAEGRRAAASKAARSPPPSSRASASFCTVYL